MALTAAVLATGAAAQTPELPATGDASFAIYLQGVQIGREQTNVARGPSGWIVTSSGRSEAPIDFTVARFEAKYAPDWQPLELTLEARLRNAVATIRTSFALTTAINEVTQNSKTVGKEDQISAKTIVLPNNVFGAYEALAARLHGTAAGTELPVYVVPQGEVRLRVRAVSEQALTGAGAGLRTRRYDVTFANPDRPVDAVVLVDDRARLVRFELPALGLLVVREDAASVALRPETARNPTDTDVSVAANGFNLAGTLTTPPGVAGRLRHPAIVLVGGVTPGDRDQVVSGVAVFAQLAKGLADAGHVVLRYDRRGAGQSGGRTESATLGDYADDVVSAVRWLARRGDVDKKRIVVAGYGDGAAAALIAASRHKEIDGVITIDAAGTRGADLILEQQQQVLNALKLSPEERQNRIEMQKRIQAAVISGTGWEGVPPAMRRQADTPWFRSVLTFDPAQAVARVKQPLLILHAELDPNIPASEADRLAALASARKKVAAPDVVKVPGAGNTLAAPGSNAVNPAFVTAIAEWVKKL
ncbi:MAG TPA: alpha/beta fold hydrolase [Vicinamibacterales bacterium]|nr:alpha/beta fold hydrolase [Vicinamibacterales bacterium]